jgi:fatty-acyl-CoA synthase
MGIPDEHWGETLVAVVSLAADSSITKADIVRYCETRLGHYKKPSRVFFIDRLERSPSGKISRKYLKELIDTLVR